jgi:UDP-GlcNAc:undecaprenyl-phosphate GlcNAc-1-phosphate transferase
MTAPLISLAIPLLDTMLTILRRLIRGQHIFSADRGHLHHRLLDRGLTPRRVALLIYGLCGLAACASLIQSFAKGHVAGLVSVLFCIGVCFGIQRLGYVEFDVARRLARVRTFRRVLNAHLRLHTLEDALARAKSIDACWTAVRSASFDFGFTHVTMYVDHTVLEDWRDRAPSPDSWTLYVPLSEMAGFITLGRGFGGPVEPMVVAPLADVLRRMLTPKLAGFRTRGPEAQLVDAEAARLNVRLPAVANRRAVRA